MGGNYFNSSNGEGPQSVSSRPHLDHSRESSFAEVEAPSADQAGQDQHPQAETHPHMSMGREQRSWSYFCNSTNSGTRRQFRREEQEQSCVPVEAMQVQHRQQTKGGDGWHWQNWCSGMYFNCTHVNRETIMSECLEEMGGGKRTSFACSMRPSSPNFGEDGRDHRRPGAGVKSPCSCACRECRMANLAEAQKCNQGGLLVPEQLKQQGRRGQLQEAGQFALG